jgi:hypothetical protein
MNRQSLKPILVIFSGALLILVGDSLFIVQQICFMLRLFLSAQTSEIMIAAFQEKQMMHLSTSAQTLSNNSKCLGQSTGRHGWSDFRLCSDRANSSSNHLNEATMELGYPPLKCAPLLLRPWLQYLYWRIR